MDNNTSQALKHFFSQYTLRHYHKGQILIYSGDEPNGIFFIEKGSIRQYDIGSTGDEILLNIFTQDVFLPASWLVSATPSKYFYEALTDIEVRRAPIETFNEFIKESPELAYSLLISVYAGIECSQKRTAMLMSGSTSQRLLLEIFLEGRRFGEMKEDGSCVIHISVSSLAQRAGLSRETISRELNKLVSDQKVLSRDGRSLILHNFSAIEKLLDLF